MENYSKLSLGSSVYRNHIDNTVSTTMLTGAFDNVTSDPIVNYLDKKAPHPFKYSIARGSRLNGIDTLENSQGKLWTTSTGVLAFDLFQWRHIVTSTESSILYNKALARLNDKVKGDLDLSVSIAEYGQVNRMIGGIYKVETYFGPVLKALESFSNQNQKRSFRNSPYKKLPNGRRIYDPAPDLAFYAKRGYKSLASILKMLGMNWLQWQYGFKPLLSDIYGVADNLLLPNVDQFVVKINAGATHKLKGLVQLGKYDSTDTVNLPPYRRDGKVGFSFKLMCKKPDLANPNRWASMNPAGLAWERLPFSFVVDWVYDIGSFLKHAETSYLMGAVLQSGYSTSLNAQSGILVVPKYRRQISDYGPQFIEGQCTYQHIEFERKLVTSWPFPRAPSLKVKLGTERLLSAASLLSLHLRGR